MAENSKIEWTDHTFNPWIGCSKVHDGCRHCYAEAQMDTRLGKADWGPQGTRVLTSDVNWKKPFAWEKRAAVAHDSYKRRCDQHGGAALLDRGFRRPPRPRVFCASLADVFEDWQGPIQASSRVALSHTGNLFACSHDLDKNPLPNTRWATMDDVRRRLFALIDATPHLDWIILTKRPENIRRMWPAVDVQSQSQDDDRNEHGEMYRRNVSLLTSVSDQASADKQIPELIECRDLCPVLGISAEPLLGPIDLSGYFGGEYATIMGSEKSYNFGLDWVIVGGESGPNARPMHPDWARGIRDQCQAAGVPFFLKRLGAWAPIVDLPTHCTSDAWLTRDGRRLIPVDGVVEFNAEPMAKVGKSAAGRLLDGREWNERPPTKEQ